MPQIRVKAMCVFQDQDRLLLIDTLDPGTGERFYKPVGGGVEFGETARACAVREVREELNVEIIDVVYRGTLELIAEFDRKPIHEIILIFEAKFTDSRIYELESVLGTDSDGTFIASWIPFDEFSRGSRRLGPPGLLELLKKE